MTEPNPHTSPQEKHHLAPEAEDKKYARALAAKRIGLGLLIIWMLVVSIVLVLGLHSVRVTQQNGSPLLKGVQGLVQQVSEQADDIQRGTDASVETNDRILDCLDPDGECYRESRKNGAAQVLTVVKGSLAGDVCAANLDTTQTLQEQYAQQRQCVAMLTKEPVR